VHSVQHIDSWSNQLNPGQTPAQQMKFGGSSIDGGFGQFQTGTGDSKQYFDGLVDLGNLKSK
jgi:hypothetical protein